MLDTDSPRFKRGLERMRRIAGAIDAAKAQAGLVGGITRVALTAAAAVAVAFARLYLTPVKRNLAPATVRLVPAW